MLTRSFIFLDGIGSVMERRLWQDGIRDWSVFLSRSRVRGISPVRKQQYDALLLEAQEAVREDDASFFLSWPSVHTWRLYTAFRSQTLFLDIEIGRTSADIILVGLFDGFNTFTLVKGSTLDKKTFFSLISRYKLLVTFNGSSFDLPALEKFFGAPISLPHIDLKHCCATLGLYGGLKEIERRLHISRPQHLYGNPVDLWRAYRASGDAEYLQLLVAYNEEDIINLKPLMEYCSRELVHRLLLS